jgi:predicted ATPase/class 3 adenylate cyclase
MPELPSGTVTFLFTDIERSTEHLAAMGNDAYADALDTHRQILREAFKTHDGHEIATEGDSFFVAFARAHDAVAAAVDGQRGLCGHPLSTRIGLHTGEALVRGNGYVGHDVHRAKRVSDAGHGGQILVSQTTADLIGDAASLIDLGPHRLKDLGEPQQIFQVGDGDFPPLRSLETFRNSLPQQRSTFIGREHDIATVRKLLDAHRLVTLTGIGGCGKTRLALQVGAELLDRYADGVFFAELAPISDPGEVVGVVTRAAQLPSGLIGTAQSMPPDEALISFLSGRRCLLILDNCEHLVDAAAEIVDRIQQSCPDVSILTTSREVLGVDGEQAFGVPSLSLAEDAGDSDATRLFVSRARAARPDFAMTSSNRSAIAEICRRLDGIPLAIEFAAARVAHLSPQQISDKLDDRFRLLTGGRRRVQRQQTLEAAMDWSFELLSSEERTLLMRLAVFPADFGLTAVEGICSVDQLDRDRITDALGSLVAKSLVEALQLDNAIRYRLLETVRAYASGHLARAGEADRFRDRHRDYFLDWLESFDWAQILAPDFVSALHEDVTNLMGAMEWSASQGRVDLLARIFTRCGGAFLIAWEDSAINAWREAIVTTDVDLDPSVRAAALGAASSWAQLQLQTPRAFDLIDRAVTVARDGHHAVLAAMLGFRGWLCGVGAAWLSGPERERLITDARRDFDEALSLVGDNSPFLAAYVAGFAGQVEMTLGDIAGGARHFEDALEPYGGGPGPIIGQSGVHLAACLHVLGKTGRAVELVEQILETPEWEPASIGFSAPVVSVLAAHDLGRARDLLVSIRSEVVRVGIPGCFEDWVIGAAGVLIAARRHEGAAKLLGWVRANTLDRGAGAGRSPAGYVMYRAHVRAARDALGPDDARRCRAEGTELSRDQVLDLIDQGLEQIDA